MALYINSNSKTQSQHITKNHTTTIHRGTGVRVTEIDGRLWVVDTDDCPSLDLLRGLGYLRLAGADIEPAAKVTARRGPVPW